MTRSPRQRRLTSPPNGRRLATPAARRVIGLGAIGVLALSVTACGGTTYDATLATSETTAPATTTTLPTGNAAELLPRLVDEAASLSGVMIDEGDDSAVVERMAALWEAAKQEVGSTRADLLASFDASIALARKAVEFRRAADADKASKNIDALVDAYLTA